MEDDELCCRRCGSLDTVLVWHRHPDGNRRVQASCRLCGSFAGTVPQTLANRDAADLTSSPGVLQGIIGRLKALGVTLVSDGRAAWLPSGVVVPPGLRRQVEMASHPLAQFIGQNNRQVAHGREG